MWRVKVVEAGRGPSWVVGDGTPVTCTTGGPRGTQAYTTPQGCLLSLVNLQKEVSSNFVENYGN